MVNTITLLQVGRSSNLPENPELSEGLNTLDGAKNINNFATKFKAAAELFSAISGKELPSNVQDNQNMIIESGPDFRIVTTAEPVSNEALFDFMVSQGLDREQILELVALSTDQKLYSSPQYSSKWLTLYQAAKRDIPEKTLVTDEETLVMDVVQVDLSNVTIIKDEILKTASRNEHVETIIQVIKLKPQDREILVTHLNKPKGIESSGSAGSASLERVISSRSITPNSSNNHPDSSQGDAPMEKGQSDFDEPVLRQKDFRDAVAEHLRKADNLKDLSERLGTFMAKQLVASLARGRWSIEMQLHPKELGTIQVEMNMTERGLEAVFKTAQVATRELLMDSMPRLKQWFEEGGINLAYTGLSDFSSSRDGEKSSLEQVEPDPSDDDLEKDEQDDGLSVSLRSGDLESTDQSFDVRV